MNFNLPTIIIGIIVLIVCFTIILKQIHDRKKGKHHCSCGGLCDGCTLKDICGAENNIIKKQ